MSIRSTPALKMFGFLLTIFSALTVAAPPVFANSTTKTFEIGIGTAQHRSHFRTFEVPCGENVSATVKYQRLGAVGTANDIPIVIELRQPGANESVDGPIAQEKQATASRTQQTASLTGSRSTRGCSKPWRVRVRHAGEGPALSTVTGEIRLTFPDTEVFELAGIPRLNKHSSKTILLGPESGLYQGTIEITASWEHSLLGLTGPLPVKLKFELIDNDGFVIATASAFSTFDLNPTAQPKLKLAPPRFSSCSGGQWKLRITNESDDDTKNIFPTARFKPSCT